MQSFVDKLCDYWYKVFNQIHLIMFITLSFKKINRRIINYYWSIVTGLPLRYLCLKKFLYIFVILYQWNKTNTISCFCNLIYNMTKLLKSISELHIACTYIIFKNISGNSGVQGKCLILIKQILLMYKCVIYEHNLSN